MNKQNFPHSYQNNKSIYNANCFVKLCVDILLKKIIKHKENTNYCVKFQCIDYVKFTSKNIMPIISGLSQFALAVIAVIVYVNTVIPIYQKESLAEEVAVLKKKSDVLSASIVNNKGILDELSSKIEIHYREIFIENMDHYSVKQITSVYIGKYVDCNKNQEDIIANAINRTVIPYDVILKCIDNYAKNNTQAYSLLPDNKKSELANEYRKKLLQRQDLQKSSFDEEKMRKLFEERDIEIKKLRLSGVALISEYEIIRIFCDKIFNLELSFREQDIGRINQFWRN